MKKKRGRKKKAVSPGSLLVQKRWANTTAEQRRAVALKMVAAKAAKRLERKKSGEPD
jgi:hypothetical protein